MFDNIIGQSDVISLLRNDVAKYTLNNSLLFHGQKHIGKLMAALELTRVLNCLEYRENNCECNSCKRINDLNFEGLIFLSRRNIKNIINELIISFKNEQNKVFIDRIKKIFKLYSLPLQDYLIKNIFSENEKNVIFKNLEKADNILFSNNGEFSQLEGLLDIIDKINSNYKKKNIPIDMIRAMLDWTYISQPDIKRVVIIDHVDLLEKSSQNILLKRLEEHAENLYFILLAENKIKVLQTILSRCRLFHFKALQKEDSKKIIEQYFNVTSEYDSLEKFLSRNDETSKGNIYPILIKLLNLVFIKEAPFSDLSIFLSAYKNKEIVKALLFEFGEMLEKEIFRKQTGITDDPIYKMLNNISFNDLSLLKELITEKYNILDIYGLNPELLLEGIFYPLKTMVVYDKI